MGKGIKALLKQKEGDMHFMLIFFILGLLLASLLISEIFRIFGINSYIKTELKRACTYAVIEATMDEYRIDYENQLDGAMAEDYFYEYLRDEMNLEKGFIKYGSEGEALYEISLKHLIVDEENAKISIDGELRVPSAFLCFSVLGDFIIPFKTRSQNVRIDGR